MRSPTSGDPSTATTVLSLQVASLTWSSAMWQRLEPVWGRLWDARRQQLTGYSPQLRYRHRRTQSTARGGLLPGGRRRHVHRRSRRRPLGSETVVAAIVARWPIIAAGRAWANSSTVKSDLQGEVDRNLRPSRANPGSGFIRSGAVSVWARLVRNVGHAVIVGSGAHRQPVCEQLQLGGRAAYAEWAFGDRHVRDGVAGLSAELPAYQR